MRVTSLHRCVVFLTSPPTGLACVFGRLNRDLYAKLFRMQRKNTIFSASVLCKHWLSFVRIFFSFLLTVAIDFHNMEKYYGSQWLPSTDWLTTFFKISSFVVNNLRASKWWQNFDFWVNCLFNIAVQYVHYSQHCLCLFLLHLTLTLPENPTRILSHQPLRWRSSM